MQYAIPIIGSNILIQFFIKLFIPFCKYQIYNKIILLQYFGLKDKYVEVSIIVLQ